MSDLAVAKIVSFKEGKTIMFDVCTMAGHRDKSVEIELTGPNSPEGLDHLTGYKPGYIYTVLTTTGHRHGTSTTIPLVITKIQGTARRRNWSKLTSRRPQPSSKHFA